MSRFLERARRTLLTGSAFLYFFVGGMFLSYVLLPLARIGRDRAEASRRCRVILARAWRFFHAYMTACGLVRYDPRAMGLELPDGPFVVVANHPTLVDVTAIISACPDVVSVAKSAMFHSPLVGRLLRYCDHIDAGDGSTFGGVAVAEQAFERLRAGTSVLVFPEGTRSPERGLGPFRPGAFDIAARAGVPIVPLFVTCEPPTLMRGQAWYEIPERTATMTVTQLPTIRPPFGAREAARTLRALYLARIEARAAAARAEIPEPAAAGSTAAT
jgi:1-acyl-sn-glycerol-3-phosphate acyltransferase